MKKIILTLALGLMIVSCDKTHTPPCELATKNYNEQVARIKEAQDAFNLNPTEDNAVKISNANIGLEQTIHNLNQQCD